MKEGLLSLIVIVLFVLTACSSQSLPTIKSTTSLIDIKVDGNLQKGSWYIDPSIDPDVFETSGKNVIFYTDIDSISFDIAPNEQYDFIIQINDKTANTRIAWTPSKLEILKKAEAYDTTDNRFVPMFTYQDQDDPNLKRTRSVLRLDSIAGNGTELSKIFNLLHWIHRTIRHDGCSTNPESRNAIDLINICKQENRGLNCRMMAIILNECYLSMGIKSRFVTCMPRESEFNDCHVINMVFSNELDKWIWIDPTFEAYIKDEKGNLLGIQEVREKLIKGEKLILNADANWNGKLETQEQYLNQYMAKNLYRMDAHAESCYNVETREKDKQITYIELLPLDGIIQTPQKKESIDHSGIKNTCYITNNPNKFWEKP